MDELGKPTPEGAEEFEVPETIGSDVNDSRKEEEQRESDSRELIDRIREGDEAAAQELLEDKYELIQHAYDHLESKLGHYLKSNELTYKFLEASGYIALHDFCRLEERFVSDHAREAFTKKLGKIAVSPDFEERLDKVIEAHIYYALWDASLNETSKSDHIQEKVLVSACQLYDRAVFDQTGTLGRKPEQSEIEAYLESAVTNNQNGGGRFKSALDITKMVESFRQIASLNGGDPPMKSESPTEEQQLENALFEEMLDYHRDSIQATLKAVRVNNKKLNHENMDLWVERYGIEDGEIKTNAEVAERHGLSPAQVRMRVWQVSESLSRLARNGKFDQVLEDDPEVMCFFKYSLYMDTVDNAQPQES